MVCLVGALGGTVLLQYPNCVNYHCTLSKHNFNTRTHYVIAATYAYQNCIRCYSQLYHVRVELSPQDTLITNGGSRGGPGGPVPPPLAWSRIFLY